MDPAQYLLDQKVTQRDLVPDVRGMGARDAVFVMERQGIKTRLNGRGKVVEQSLKPGEKARKGATCQLTLQYRQ
jgi:cell division protein FtsI (penicillin-binding protein 3)